MSSDVLHYEVKDRIAFITLNRPDGCLVAARQSRLYLALS